MTVVERSRASFNGLRVTGFESRRATEMTRMLEAAGAVAHVSPSMREVPLGENRQAADFARGLIAGDFDIVIFMTGVGFRLLMRSLRDGFEEAVLVEALRRVRKVARGPKPVAAMQEVGLSADVRIGEPNTWRDILASCRDQAPDVRGAKIAVQEHGLPSTALQAGLEELGATVVSVPVYEWALPEDIEPLHENLRRIVAGQVDVALFTSSRQVAHMLFVAGQMGIEEGLRVAFRKLVVGSIGPTTSETLSESGISVDFEPAHPKLGHLVTGAAAKSSTLLADKRGTPP
jgi:uroporphyrinogen-III synthase